MAAPGHILLFEGQRLARRQPDLEFDQVDAGHQLGHRMLDLEARIHLQEVEVGLFHQELDGAEVLVADRSCARAGNAAHLGAQRVVEGGRRTLFDQFLMATLHTTLAFAEMHHVAAAVGGDLDLDVVSALDQAFQVQAAVAEVRLRLNLGDGKGAGQLVHVMRGAHAAAAAASDCLEHERKPELAGS